MVEAALRFSAKTVSVAVPGHEGCAGAAVPVKARNRKYRPSPPHANPSEQGAYPQSTGRSGIRTRPGAGCPSGPCAVASALGPSGGTVTECQTDPSEVTIVTGARRLGSPHVIRVAVDVHLVLADERLPRHHCEEGHGARRALACELAELQVRPW